MEIYPDSEGQVPLVLNLNKGSTYENNVSARDDVNIIKLGFKIPNKPADYDDFKMQINESELVLQNFITSQIQYVKWTKLLLYKYVIIHKITLF